ncbi:MAG: alkaline phosphatase family protein [Anaerolineae bacterium]
MSNKRVLIIGLDGGTLDVIEPWAEAGHLPNFRRLLREGCSGRLKSTIPALSPPAWTSFMTGVNPGKHGLFDFLKRRPGSYELQPVRNDLPSLDTMFAWASRHGRRVGVLNVPMTYPPEWVNGFMVSGLGAPDDVDYAYPAGLADELRASGYRINNAIVYEPGREDAFIRDVMDTTDRRAEVALQLMNREPWDLFTVVFRNLDGVLAFLWAFMDETHPRHDPQLGERYGDAVLRYHQLLDRRLGDFLAAVDDNTVVLIMSDHGGGPLYKEVYLNVWLQQEGFQRLRQGVGAVSGARAMLRRAGLTRESLTQLVGWRNVNRMKDQLPAWLTAMVPRATPDIAEVVDWSQTLAYSFGYIGQIYINLRGREPHGIVQPGSEYRRVVDEIVGRLWELEDPETGERVVDAIYLRDDIYHGPHAHEGPDINVTMRGMSYISHLGLEFVGEQVFGPAPNYETGTHRQYGMLVVWGPGVRQGHIENVEIIDLAPTILHMLGVPVPEDMDGRVLGELYEGNVRPAERVSREPAGGGPADLAGDEEAQILERLKKLGYLG